MKASSSGLDAIAARGLRELPENGIVTIEKLERGGSLQARRLAGGAIQFYWRYSHEGTTHREPIGPFDPSAPPKKFTPTARGYSVAAAREHCRTLAETHRQRLHTGGLREAKVEQRREYLARKEAEAKRSQHRLDALLDLYVWHLDREGRRSAYDARLVFRLHVIEAWPKIAAMPAAEVTPDHVVDMQRRLIEAGKGRTANKLRAYLRAAFQCAIDVRSTASIPVAFKAFAVVFNPAAQTRREARFDRPDKRPLSADEMRAYWKAIRSQPGLRAAALRLHLLTGAQRIEQLLRLKRAEAFPDRIVIYDGKGRPGQGPRTHTLPVIEEARRQLAAFDHEGEYLISTTSGRRPVSTTTMAGWAKALVGDSIDGFQLKRVRSGVETLLASKGISRDIRGQLQSHGLTGLQARHYDGHDYMAEKRHALEVLLASLSEVVPGLPPATMREPTSPSVSARLLVEADPR